MKHEKHTRVQRENRQDAQMVADDDGPVQYSAVVRNIRKTLH
jgi:hypothetical protein